MGLQAPAVTCSGKVDEIKALRKQAAEALIKAAALSEVCFTAAYTIRGIDHQVQFCPDRDTAKGILDSNYDLDELKQFFLINGD